MKKTLFITVAAFLLGLSAPVKAQDCDAIVAPLITIRNLDDSYPAEKLAHYCQISQNSFYFTEQIPDDAVAYNLREVTNSLTGENIPKNFVVDLNTFSYWGYNFIQFQAKHQHQTIYFRLGSNNTYPYLAVRPREEAHARTDYPERYKD